MSKAALPFRAVLCGTVVLLLAAAFLLAPSASSAADGKELLRRLGVTPTEMNYRGQQMVIDFSRLTPQVTRLSVVHELGGRERREYHGSRSVSVIDGDYFYQYHPDRNLVVKRKLPGDGGYDSLRKESLEQTLVSYHLESSPSEPIAGREAHMYAFLPKESGSRPGRKVWVDVETGLILRMEIYSPDEKLFWLSVYEDIEYSHSVNPASFAMPLPEDVKVVEVGEERCSAPAEAETIAGFSLTLPGHLPEGFVRKCIRALRSIGHGEIKVLYSDGLSLLTIFESSRFRPFGGPGSGFPVRVGDFPATLHQIGLVSALNWESSGTYLTILGELPRQELIKVADSIRPFREHSRP